MSDRKKSQPSDIYSLKMGEVGLQPNFYGKRQMWNGICGKISDKGISDSGISDRGIGGRRLVAGDGWQGQPISGDHDLVQASVFLAKRTRKGLNSFLSANLLLNSLTNPNESAKKIRPTSMDAADSSIPMVEAKF